MGLHSHFTVQNEKLCPIYIYNLDKIFFKKDLNLRYEKNNNDDNCIYHLF